MKQLSKLKRITLAAVAILVTRGAVIARVIALPVIISITLKTTALHAGSAYFVYASWIIDWLLFVFVAVSLHRVCLGGEHSLPRFGTLTAPGWSDGMYALVALLLSAGLVAYTYASAFVMRLLGMGSRQTYEGFMATVHFISNWFWLLVMLLLIARFSLWLPAVALGHRYSFREIWRLGRRHNMLLMVSIIGLPIMFFYLFSVPANLVVEITPLNQLIRLIPYLIGLVLLSVTYAEISRDQSAWRTEEERSKD